MGSDEEYGKSPGQFSVQGRAEAHRDAAAAREGRAGRDLALPFVCRNNEGGRDCPDTDVNPSEAEYGRAIYYDAANSEPVRKGHQAAGRADSYAAVGTGGD